MSGNENSYGKRLSKLQFSLPQESARTITELASVSFIMNATNKSSKYFSNGKLFVFKLNDGIALTTEREDIYSTSLDTVSRRT
jgi:hypothetical protein